MLYGTLCKPIYQFMNIHNVFYSKTLPFLAIVFLFTGCSFDSVIATGKVGESLSDIKELFEPPLSEVCAYPGLTSRCDDLRKKTENALLIKLQ